MDIEKILNEYADESGNLGTLAVSELAAQIKKAVGTTFVPKERYDKLLGQKAELESRLSQTTEQAAAEEKLLAELDLTKREYEDYRASVEGERLSALRTNAISSALKEAGVNEKVLGLMLKGLKSRESEIEITEDGRVADSQKLIEPLLAEYPEFFATEDYQGVLAGNPPITTNALDPFMDGFKL